MVDEKSQVTKPDTEPAIDISANIAETSDTESPMAIEGLGDETRDSTAPDSDCPEKLAAAETLARENHDRTLRVLAEFENYKKRTARENADFRKFAHENFAREILGVLDNLERAIKSSNDGEDSGRCVVAGVEMILKDLIKILEKFSVKPIQAVGANFDPMFHQAVSQVPSRTQEPNTVIEEFQKGYMIHDRLLRPSMVVVSKAMDPIGSQGPNEIQQN